MERKNKRSKRSKRSNSKRSKTKNNRNKWYNLLVGIINGMANGTVITSLNTCLPESWKVEDLRNNDDVKKEADKKDEITRALDVLSKIIEFLCKFKDAIKGIVTQFIKRMRKNKVFFEKTMKRYRKSKDFFGDILSQVDKVKDFVVKGWEENKDFGTKVANDIVKFWNGIKDKLALFLNADLVSNVDQIIKCYEKAKNTGEDIVRVLRGIHSKVSTIVSQGWVGFASVLVDLICKFEEFRKTVQVLLNGLAETDVAKKFLLYGEFTGKIIKLIGNARFRQMKLALI